MKTEIERLDELTEATDRAQGLALQAQDAVRREQSGHATYLLSIIHDKLNHVRLQLILMGGRDPIRERTLALRAEREAQGITGFHNDGDVPIHLLNSEKAQVYAKAMREAARACKAMEDERGIYDGIAERLGDYADIAEMECFGPKGLEGG